MIHFLTVAHIAVLGYWLGAELVINHTFRYVCRASLMPVSDRTRLMDHVMNVDQHVRYALVLQFTLGFLLTLMLGYLPGGGVAATIVAAAGLMWLALVELTHRNRSTRLGNRLARIDRLVRYSVMVFLLLMAFAAWESWLGLPGWLALKLLCFAGVMACGVGIRFALMPLGPIWKELHLNGSSPPLEKQIQRIYIKSTSILCGLWLLIAAIVYLSLVKP